MKRFRTFAGALAATLAVTLFSATPAFPQATAGEITGRVLDTAGAASPALR